MRRRKIAIRSNRGFFVDVRTLAAALTSRSHSLQSLGKFLEIPHPKLEANEHGAALTEGYVNYALGDVQASWECYEALAPRYGRHRLLQTPMHAIESEASLGKAYLREMGSNAITLSRSKISAKTERRNWPILDWSVPIATA